MMKLIINLMNMIKKIGNTSDNDEIKLLVEELNGIYKGRDDIKMVKIS